MVGVVNAVYLTDATVTFRVGDAEYQLLVSLQSLPYGIAAGDRVALEPRSLVREVDRQVPVAA